jgi:hypothetical protein
MTSGWPITSPVAVQQVALDSGLAVMFGLELQDRLVHVQ